MTVQHREDKLRTAEGLSLYRQEWTHPDQPTATLLMVHGYLEHSGRYWEFAHHLALAGYRVVAFDLRGHGQSGGPRGHVDAFERYLEDLDLVVNSLDAPSPWLCGHSFGALVAIDWASKRAQPLRGLILTSPFLAPAEQISPLRKNLGRVLSRWLPSLPIPTGMPAEVVSRDPSIVDQYRRDPLNLQAFTPRWSTETLKAQERVRSVSGLSAPTLVVHSDSDRVADPRVIAQWAERLSAPLLDVWLRPGAGHEVLNELDRTELFGQITGWMAQTTAQPVAER